ncbi:MAG: MBL fold metallo-hydrolase [Alphaproteobacteria bacterium]|jgi:glyoxylase-like metal-dependent hydrolase (beta-lactamase superfamily II)
MAIEKGLDSVKPIAEVWFSIEVCDNDIIRLRESHIDSYAVGDIWLVRGSERDLVVDTGSGIVPPAPLVQAIAQKPVTAVALNSYYDHAGGWNSFLDRACHPIDAPALNAPDREQADVSTYLNDTTLWSLPWEGYRVEDYVFIPATPSRLVEDGDIFDLGDRSLQVLHVPGRSSGGLALWEAATGSLFTSDMLYDGNHGPAWPPSDPESYCSSIRRMRKLPVKHVYPGHYGTMDGARMLEVIDEQLADLEQQS